MAFCTAIFCVNLASMNEALSLVEFEVGDATGALFLPIGKASWFEELAIFILCEVVVLSAFQTAIFIGDMAVLDVGEGVAVIVD